MGSTVHLCSCLLFSSDPHAESKKKKKKKTGLVLRIKQLFAIVEEDYSYLCADIALP